MMNKTRRLQHWCSGALILCFLLAAPALAGVPDGEDLEGTWVGSWREKNGELDGSVRVYVSGYMGVAYVEYFLDGTPFGEACAEMDSGGLRLVKGEDFNNKKIRYRGEDPTLGDTKLRTKGKRLKAKGPAACSEDGPEWKGRAKVKRKDFMKGNAKIEFPDGEKRKTRFSAERERFRN